MNGAIENISITIEDNNNFDYDVETSIMHISPRSNHYSRLAEHLGTVVKTEIADENNESYVFAALQSVDEQFDNGTLTRPVRGASRSSVIKSSLTDNLVADAGQVDSKVNDEPITPKERKKSPRL